MPHNFHLFLFATVWQLNFKQYFLSRGGNSTTLQQQYSNYCGSHKNDDALSLLYFYGPCDSIGVVNVWPEDLLLWVPCFCPERIPKPSMENRKARLHLQYIKINFFYWVLLIDTLLGLSTGIAFCTQIRMEIKVWYVLWLSTFHNCYFKTDHPA